MWMQHLLIVTPHAPVETISYQVNGGAACSQFLFICGPNVTGDVPGGCPSQKVCWCTFLSTMPFIDFKTSCHGTL